MARYSIKLDADHFWCIAKNGRKLPRLPKLPGEASKDCYPWNFYRTIRAAKGALRSYRRLHKGA